MTDDERREKQRQYFREWRKRNPEKVKAAQRKYYETHAEERRANTARWRKNNPERVLEYQTAYLASPQRKKVRRAWLEANRERHAEHARQSRERHPATVKEYARRYRKARPDVISAVTQRRRARKRNAPGSFTAGEWNALCALYDHRCLCCGKDEPEITLVPDHVVPLARGGSNHIANIQPLCVRCNSRKHTRIIDYRTRTLPEQMTLPLFDDSHAVVGQDEGEV